VLTQPTTPYERWMHRALQVAQTVPDPGAGDPPVGAVIYDQDGTEIAAAHHDRERTGDPTAYAEVLALRQAGRTLGTWRLEGCTLVTTLEPGTMSAGAIVLARIPRLIIGTWDKHNGAICSQWDLVRDRRLNHNVEVIPEILKPQCDALLNRYLDTPSPHQPSNHPPR
jgi:tRNA(adenine34) deaminase